MESPAIEAQLEKGSLRKKDESNVSREGNTPSRRSSKIIDTEPPSPSLEVSSPSRIALALEELSPFSLLSFFSIWGVLARLGLVAIFTFDGASVFPLLWAQVVGCFVMGILSARKTELMRWDEKLHPSLATGFCGSLTTFSSWMLDVFLAFSNPSQSQGRHSGGNDFLDGLNQTAVTMGMSMAALMLGQHLSSLLPPLPSPTPVSSQSSSRKTIRWAQCLYPSLLLLWLGSIFLAIFHKPWRGKLSFSLIFGPLGTYLRFQLSRHLNPLHSSFPLGTFTANILGTLLLSSFYSLQHLHSPHSLSSISACQILQGLSDGFCGTLSTVSTFVLEVQTLKGRNKWRYGVSSWAIGQVACVLVLGIPTWTGRVGIQKCPI
ncbi:hypothetical protein BT69DRAFT_1215851 [Atractiella rhizophila]|nr:hypothetical protein BT69DRAFT_1215851 [Atractiella rhizophila]